MKKTVGLGVIIILICFSCNTKPRDTLSFTVTDVPVSTNVEQNDGFINPSDSGVVKLKLVDGEGRVKTRKAPNQTIFIEFKSKGYKKVMAHLTSQDASANIRFSQIFLPDGTMDGPFGRDLEYQLLADGLYRISIHENMMAGDPWNGEFEVEVKLE